LRQINAQFRDPSARSKRGQREYHADRGPADGSEQGTINPAVHQRPVRVSLAVDSFAPIHRPVCALEATTFSLQIGWGIRRIPRLIYPIKNDRV